MVDIELEKVPRRTLTLARISTNDAVVQTLKDDFGRIVPKRRSCPLQPRQICCAESEVSVRNWKVKSRLWRGNNRRRVTKTILRPTILSINPNITPIRIEVEPHFLHIGAIPRSTRDEQNRFKKPLEIVNPEIHRERFIDLNLTQNSLLRRDGLQKVSFTEEETRIDAREVSQHVKRAVRDSQFVLHKISPLESCEKPTKNPASKGRVSVDL